MGQAGKKESTGEIQVTDLTFLALKEHEPVQYSYTGQTFTPGQLITVRPEYGDDFLVREVSEVLTRCEESQYGHTTHTDTIIIDNEGTYERNRKLAAIAVAGIFVISAFVIGIAIMGMVRGY